MRRQRKTLHFEALSSSAISMLPQPIHLRRARFGRSTVEAAAPTYSYLTASYFLARGGISDVSTGSNSNFGSSASGAKYAFVVFRKFLSSRSGKSGL